MKCRRAEELFSDDAEGSLAPPLDRELQAHFDSCAACTSLYAAFREVVGALEASSTPAPPETLLPQLTTIAPSTTLPLPMRRETPRLAAASSWLAVAAVIALMLLWRPPELASELSRKTSRTARQAYSFSVRTYHQAERWIEDLNVLRITVGVAFEDSLDRINEQLRDLELTGRRSDDDGEQSREIRPSPTRQRASLLTELSSRSPL